MNHEDWGEGPWNHEEDHAVWVDPATGLDCMINRGPAGALCGYVGVPPSNFAHGRDYQDLNVVVHGGLTYSKACQEDGEICHVPEPGREHDIWWLGFDCAHFTDVMPKHDADMRALRKRDPELDAQLGRLEDFPDPFPRTYKDWAYVKAEIELLAAQLDILKNIG